MAKLITFQHIFIGNAANFALKAKLLLPLLARVCDVCVPSEAWLFCANEKYSSAHIDFWIVQTNMIMTWRKLYTLHTQCCNISEMKGECLSCGLLFVSVNTALFALKSILCGGYVEKKNV